VLRCLLLFNFVINDVCNLEERFAVLGINCYTCHDFNPLWSRGTYSVTSNNMKLVHWPLTDGLLNLVHREGDWAVPNVTAHPSTASVPITVLLYDCSLLCGFDVPIKR